MSTATSSFLSSTDGTKVVTYAWTDVAGKPAGVVQVAHGLAEHGERYDRFARALNAAGFLVYAVDHRGHGRTADGRLGDFGPAGFAGLIADVAQFGAALRAQHGSRFLGPTVTSASLSTAGRSGPSFAVGMPRASRAARSSTSQWNGASASSSTVTS